MVRRVAITGLGAITAAGTGVEMLWQATRDGQTGIRQIVLPHFENARVRIAADVRDFDPLSFLTPQVNAATDRFAALAILAADEALAQAQLQRADLGERTSVIIGTGAGGVVTTDRSAYTFYVSKERPDPMSVPKTMPNAAASQISMRYGARGPTFAISSACASSSQAIGLGFQMVRAGMVDQAIVGGSESMLTPAAMRAWEILRVLTPTATRPFSKGRDGMVLGDGAAVLVLEDFEAAKARGAVILAELAGYGTSSDALDLLRPDPVGAARAMQLALDDAGLAPTAIGYINAHGTGTVLNDVAETAALQSVFGAALDHIPVSSTKPVHGHTIGAAGAVELIVAIKAMSAQIAPPTLNWLGEDPKCAIDVVPNLARAAPMDAVMSNSFAFGGINASLVLKRV